MVTTSLLCFACHSGPTDLDEPAWLDVQLGTELDDEVFGVAIHPQGGVYVTGYDNGDNSVINEGPVGDAHAFVVRLLATGETAWRKNVDTPAADLGERIVRSASDGHLFVAGSTSGAFPGETNRGNFDLFVSELDADGNTLRIAQVGREVSERVAGLALDDQGVFLSGQDDVKLEGRAVVGWQDAFALALDRPMAAPNPTPRWSRHHGSAIGDYAGGIAAAADGSAVYVAGYVPAGSERGPYVDRLDATGAVVWHTRLSMIGFDVATAIGLAPSGELYVTGGTLGTLGPKSFGEQDVFVMRLDRGTGAIEWTAQLGSTASEIPWALAFGPDGSIVVAGETLGTVDPGRPYGGNGDAFAMAIDTNGTVLHTWQGATSGDDVARTIAVDAKGHAYVGGYTEGALVPDATPRGRRDAFVIRAW